MLESDPARLPDRFLPMTDQIGGLDDRSQLPQQRPAGPGLVLLHTGTILASSFLLFSVQLIVAKFFIVWFGGSSSVWITAMLFFQALLLAGYGYSHALTTRLSPAAQAQTHTTVLLASAAVLVAQYAAWGGFLLPDQAWKPQSQSHPVLKLLGLLALSTGTTFFVTATTTSLLQTWFSRANPGRSPFPLYATSNAASLLALLAYPLAIEPLVGLQTQATVWGGLYFMFVGMCLVAARLAGLTASGPHDVTASQGHPARSEPMSLAVRPLWVLLPLCGSVVFLATTNWITQEIGSLPLLWSLPLALYLLSFYLTFRGGDYPRHLWFPLACLAAFGAMVARIRSFEANPNWFEFVKIGAPLFACLTACVVCHGELHRLRPASTQLTAFNLSIAVGGVLGGIFVAVLAPFIFRSIAEFPIGLVGSAILVMVCLEREWRRPGSHAGRITFKRAGAVAVIVVMITGLTYRNETRRLAAWRNFYGTSSVRKTEILANGAPCDFYQLYHGRVRHGTQVGPPYRGMPTAYFSNTTGLGFTIRYLQQAKPGPHAVGIIGLGAGTIAAYGREGDTYRFYEIDDRMIRIARGESGFFTFLEDSKASVAVIPGDGRTSLESELRGGEPHDFDLLVLDAFSGDSPPTHLATREAFELYLQHLADDGIIAVNISNRYFDFRRSYEPMARELGLAMRGYASPDDGGITFAAAWLLLARDEKVLAALDASIPLNRITLTHSQSPAWTDDLNSLLPLIRWF